MIISVTGMPGSGKSVVASVISRILKYPVYSMGDIVRREVVKRGLPLTSSNIELVARKLREEMGEEAVALLLVEKLREDKVSNAIVDGLRSIAEARLLAKLGDLCIVAVHSSPGTRFERILRRARKGDAVTWEEFVERDMNNLRLGIGEIIALADFMIVNEGTMQELERNAWKVAEMIRNGKGKSCSGGRY
jgi:dephospho-CoA kinase